MKNEKFFYFFEKEIKKMENRRLMTYLFSQEIGFPQDILTIILKFLNYKEALILTEVYKSEYPDNNKSLIWNKRNISKKYSTKILNTHIKDISLFEKLYDKMETAWNYLSEDNWGLFNEYNNDKQLLLCINWNNEYKKLPFLQYPDLNDISFPQLFTYFRISLLILSSYINYSCFIHQSFPYSNSKRNFTIKPNDKYRIIQKESLDFFIKCINIDSPTMGMKYENFIKDSLHIETTRYKFQWKSMIQIYLNDYIDLMYQNGCIQIIKQLYDGIPIYNRKDYNYICQCEIYNENIKEMNYVNCNRFNFLYSLYVNKNLNINNHCKIYNINIHDGLLLIIACENNNENIIKELLKCGIKMNKSFIKWAKNRDLTGFNWKPNNIKSINIKVFGKAIKTDNLSLIKFLTQSGFKSCFRANFIYKHLYDDNIISEQRKNIEKYLLDNFSIKKDNYTT
jgi:hypothetical protein